MKQTLYKSSKYIVFFSTAVAFLFAACSNISKEADKTPLSSPSKYTTITGTLSTAIESRSAITSYNDITWSVKATNENDTVSAVMNGTSFSITLYHDTWTFTVTGKNQKDQTVMTGSKSDVLVTDETSSISIPVNLTARTGRGTIQLSITDETKSIVRAECTLTQLTSASEPTEINFNFEDGAGLLFEEDVEAGKYQAKISFFDNDNKEVFSCSETITVLPNLITDKWTDENEYITDGNFTITQEDIFPFLQANITTPIVLWNSSKSDLDKTYVKGAQVFGAADSSTTVTTPLFTASSNKWCFDDEQNLYVVDDSEPSAIAIYKYELKEFDYYTGYKKIATPIVKESIAYHSSFMNLTWATDGTDTYLYLLYRESDSTSNASLKVYDITGWKPASASIATAALSKNQSSGSWAVVDGEDEGKLVSSNSGEAQLAASGNDVYIARRYQISSQYTQVNEYNSYNTRSIGLEILHFTVNTSTPELVYAGDSDCIDITIGDYFTAEMDGEGNPVTDGDGNTVYERNTGLIPNLYPAGHMCVLMNDMRVIGDYLYVLVTFNSNYRVYTTYNTEESYRESNNFETSTGGIIRVNLNTREVEEWLDGSKVFGWHTAQADVYDFLVEKEVSPQLVSTTPTKADCHSYFYGPRKIIAIKPDELVIADDGYEYDDSGMNNHKEKNRLVTVSLKNWAITAVQDASVMFDGSIYISSGNLNFSYAN